MGRKKLTSILLALIVSATFGLAGCGSSTTTVSSSGNTDKDQYINAYINVGDIKTLDASIGTDAYAAYILQETMEAIARDEIKDGKDQFVPDGATGWDISKDGKTWTIHLRESVWTDGKPVTADQYEYAIKRSLDQKTASQYAYLLIGAGITGAGAYNSGKGSADKVGVKALDKSTLEIKLDRPCAYFEKLLSNKLFIAQRKDLIDKYGAKYGTTADTLLYNGPFKISSFKNGDKVELVKNDQYWDKDSVKLQKLNFLFLSDRNARMNSFMSGQIDYVVVGTVDWKNKFEKLNKYDETSVKYPGTQYMFFNAKNKYLSNNKIRKALSIALDRNEYAKVVNQGIGQPAFGWVPPSMLIGNDDFRTKVPEELKDIKDDPKALLIDGLKEIGADPDPAKVNLTYLEMGTSDAIRQDGDYFINTFKTKLGINLKVDYMEWAEANDKVNKGNYDMSSMSWYGDYNDPMTFFDMFETGAGIVPTNWSNKDFDNLVESAKMTQDNAKRQEYFAKAEKILLVDQAVISPFDYQQNPEFKCKYIKGLQEPLFAPNSLEWKYAYTSGR